MKVHHREFTKNKSGKIVLTAEEPEDLWHVYNMLLKGDGVQASTVRNVKKESSTGLRTTERKHFKLTIKIETLDFDQTVCCLSMKGTNTEQNEFVNIGQYHTIDLELGKRFTIFKDEWDSITLRRIKEATDMNLKAEVGAVVMEEGLAHVCLVLSALTVVKQKIQLSIKGKRRPDKHEESIKKFFKNVASAMKANFDLNRLKCIIIASPGFVREDFMEYIFIQNEENKPFIEHRGKFVSCRCSSGYKHSLMEVLQDPNVARRLEDTKAAKETKAFDTFQNTLMEDSDRAFYGTKQVKISLSESFFYASRGIAVQLENSTETAWVVADIDDWKLLILIFIYFMIKLRFFPTTFIPFSKSSLTFVFR